MPGGVPFAPGYELYVGGGPKPGTEEKVVALVDIHVVAVPDNSEAHVNRIGARTLTSSIGIVGHDVDVPAVSAL